MNRHSSFWKHRPAWRLASAASRSSRSPESSDGTVRNENRKAVGEPAAEYRFDDFAFESIRQGCAQGWSHRDSRCNGGPGFDHEYLEAFDSHFPGAGIEYYYYDQLGSFFSDQPDDPSLLDLARYVDEVEQVRRAHPEHYFPGMISFIRDVDSGKF